MNYELTKSQRKFINWVIRYFEEMELIGYKTKYFWYCSHQLNEGRHPWLWRDHLSKFLSMCDGGPILTYKYHQQCKHMLNSILVNKVIYIIPSSSNPYDILPIDITHNFKKK